jgi:hypothetical protein
LILVVYIRTEELHLLPKRLAQPSEGKFFILEISASNFTAHIISTKLAAVKIVHILWFYGYIILFHVKKSVTQPTFLSRPYSLAHSTPKYLLFNASSLITLNQYSIT